MNRKPENKIILYKVIRYALVSRVLVLSSMVLWRSVATPYDTSSILNPSCLSLKSSTASNFIIPEDSSDSLLKKFGNVLEGSVVWDSVYYVRIAQCGYEYEQTYAFLPFLPICMKILSQTIFLPLVPFMGERAVLVLSGYALNNVAFVLAAIFLYKLTAIIFKDFKIALYAAILFCFNPASVFYSSIYSECLFAMLSFSGIYYLLLGCNWKAMVLFAVSSSVRSNGVLNAGFFLFQAMHRTAHAFLWMKKPMLSLQVLMVGFLQSTFVFVPFVSFQVYGFLNMCRGELTSGGSRPWCNNRIPYLYGFIQSHYWDVGFLRYFQLKQLPNFILASPMLFLGAFVVILYLKQNSKFFLTMGFCASPSEKLAAATFYLVQPYYNNKVVSEQLDVQHWEMSSSISKGADSVRHRSQGNNLRHGTCDKVHSNAKASEFEENKQAFSTLSLPFVVQLAFMLFVASFVMHVQVSTRFLSVSPPIYWFAAILVGSSEKTFRRAYVIWVLFFSYLLFGSLLFSNFYPFT